MAQGCEEAGFGCRRNDATANLLERDALSVSLRHELHRICSPLPQNAARGDM